MTAPRDSRQVPATRAHHAATAPRRTVGPKSWRHSGEWRGVIEEENLDASRVCYRPARSTPGGQSPDRTADLIATVKEVLRVICPLGLDVKRSMWWETNGDAGPPSSPAGSTRGLVPDKATRGGEGGVPVGTATDAGALPADLTPASWLGGSALIRRVLAGKRARFVLVGGLNTAFGFACFVFYQNVVGQHWGLHVDPCTNPCHERALCVRNTSNVRLPGFRECAAGPFWRFESVYLVASQHERCAPACRSRGRRPTGDRGTGVITVANVVLSGPGTVGSRFEGKRLVR